MPDGPYVHAGDYRYGSTCPICAEPKSVQALRCRRCYADTLRRDRPDRRSAATARCACGKPMCSTSTRCRSCYLAAPDPAPADHPWRRYEAVRLAKARRLPR